MSTADDLLTYAVNLTRAEEDSEEGFVATDDLGEVRFSRRGSVLMVRDERRGDVRLCRSQKEVRGALDVQGLDNPRGLIRGEVLTPLGRFTFGIEVQRDRQDRECGVKFTLNRQDGTLCFGGVVYDRLYGLIYEQPGYHRNGVMYMRRSGERSDSCDLPPTLLAALRELLAQGLRALVTPQARHAARVQEARERVTQAQLAETQARDIRETAQRALESLLTASVA